MKTLFKLSLAVVGILLLSSLAIPSGAAVPLDKLKVDLGLQYRVMYNFSNIGTVNDYDFFRQRMRISLDVKPAANVGGFAQIEYRGGWGGLGQTGDGTGAPAASDIPFNRLRARGIRYGYIYASPVEGHTLLAGIIPASDQVGDTLFSADWDFNVGGIAYMGKAEPLNYRAAYVRLVEDSDDKENDQNGHVYVLDANTSLNAINLGGHIYYVSIDGGAAGLQKITEGYYGVTASTKVNMVNLNGFVLFNSGEIADESNDGVGVKVEGSIPIGEMKISVMGLMTTGDETPTKGFQTIQGLLGSGGYWAYTYIFTPHGPSDVNDFRLEIGNKGYGLTTIQAKVDIPITDRLDGQVQIGWFQSSEDVVITGSETDNGLGTEFGGQIKYGVAKNLNLEAGVAFASIGDAGVKLYQVAGEDSVKEVFGRFQLEF